MIFNPFWITLTELLVVPGTSSTSPVSAPDIYIYIYIYILNWGIDVILELPWQENPANTFMRHTEHWTAVSTLFGLISNAHSDLHHWRSNQQPQYAKVETLPLGHWFMPHMSDAELTSHGELRDHFDLMCLEGYVIPTEDTPGLRLP